MDPQISIYKMKPFRNGFLMLGLALFLMACPAKKEETTQTPETTEAEAPQIVIGEKLFLEKDGLTIYEMTGSPAYSDASLALTSLTPSATEGTDEGTPLAFKFDVKNYELGAQTEGVEATGLANSDKGQHIHLIVDNGPYSAHYEPEFEKPLSDGNHVILAFLSRSWHESVKSPGAFLVTQYKVGEGDAPQADLKAQHLFYSRPKGTYTGKDTKRILLDFYLFNTTLSDEGNKVIVVINDKTKFMVPKWAPYVIEGLPMGENKITLMLVGPDGAKIPGPFNEVSRTFMLAEAPGA
jgi:hypothetical protein